MSRSGAGIKCKLYKDLHSSNSHHRHHYKAAPEELCLHSPEEEEEGATSCRSGGDTALNTTGLADSVGTGMPNGGSIARRKRKSGGSSSNNVLLSCIKPNSTTLTGGGGGDSKSNSTATPAGGGAAGPLAASSSSSYLKSSSCTSPDNSSIETACTSKEIDQFYMNTTEVMSENAHLRELLLSQLDIIQQQSDTIIQRDRQMRALRIENEQLRQRLERMERRVRGGDPSPSSSPRPPTTAASPAAKTSIISSSATHLTEPAVLKRSRKRSADTDADRPHLPAMKMIKLETPPPTAAPTAAAAATELSLSRRLHSYAGSEFPLDNLTDEIFAESDESFTSPTAYPAAAGAGSEQPANGDGNGDVDRRPVSNRESDLKRGATPSGQLSGRWDEEEGKEAVSTPATTTTVARKKLSQKLLAGDKESGGLGGGTLAARKGGAGRRAGRLPSRPSITVSVSGDGGEPLLTSYHYYVGCGNEVRSLEDKLSEIALLQQGVEVPRWREDVHYKINLAKNKTKKNRRSESPGWSVVPVRPSSQCDNSQEAIEITEDSHFLKRHEKRELAEKRTKKWDMQRARERCYNEKLKARYQGVGGNKRRPEEPDTLLPALEGAEKIRVAGDLPVFAFGETVPSLSVSRFDLPWLDEEATPAASKSDVAAAATACGRAAVKSEGAPLAATSHHHLGGNSAASRRSKN